MLSFKTESLALSKIALPLVASYVAELAMVLATQIIVGRLGYEELAAVGLASHVSFEILLIGMGLLSVVGVLIARAQSVDEYHQAGLAARQGLLLAALLSVPCVVVVIYLPDLLSLTAQDPRVLALSQAFLLPFASCVPAIFLFSVLRSFMAATSRTLVIMIITVTGVAVHYVLTLMLVKGYSIIPALGVAGAGWSMSIVNWLMFLALALYVWRARVLKPYAVFQGGWRFVGYIQRELMWLGVPVAGLVLLESGLFMAVAILSGVLGAITLAACEILLTWVSFAFVWALGLAEAAMVRVAYGMGRDSLADARRSGMVALLAGAIVAVLLVAIPLAFPEYLVAVFLDPNDRGYADVSALVLQLLFIAAVFQLFDGLQVIAARSLRAMKDTLVPLWMAAFGYWVLGIGGGCFLCFTLGYGAVGLWWGLAVGLIVTATLLSLRFNALTRAPTLVN